MASRYRIRQPEQATPNLAPVWMVRYPAAEPGNKRPIFDLAGSLGGLLALIAVLNWRGRRETQGGLGLPLLLLALMAFQALLSVGGTTPVAKPLLMVCIGWEAWLRLPCCYGCGCANALNSAMPILRAPIICVVGP